MPNAGKLRSWVTIQQRDDGQDAAGQPLTTWSPWQTVWARVVSKSGLEPYVARQFAPEVSHQVTLRWIDGLTPMHRILTGEGMILDILTVNYGERKMDDTVTLLCKQRIGEAGDVDVG